MQSQPHNPLKMLAESICRRGLEAPAIFFLELTKPLVGCMRELCGVSEPLQRIIFGAEHAPAIREVLESSEQVEKLIQLLECKNNSVA